MKMFNGLIMGGFNAYRVLFDANVESGGENTGDKGVEAYKKVMNELKQLEDQNITEDDEVKLVNKDLNNALTDYLITNSNRLNDLKEMVQKLESSKEKGGQGFAILVNFLENIENKSLEDYNEFMEKLDNPKKLSNMNKSEIDRVKTYIENNKAKAKELYIKMKTVDLEKYKKIDQKDKDVFNGVREVIKTKYNNDPDFLNEDFKDFNDSIDSLKKYAGDGWNGENLADNATLQHFDSAKTIISKEFFIKTFNTYNDQRINGIKTAIINGCYDKLADKYIFQKTSGGILQYKLKDEKNWTDITSENIAKELGEDIKELIRNQDNLLNNEEDRLLSEFSSEIYTSLLTNNKIQQATKTTDEPEESSAETTTIGESERAMDERDFAAMTKALGDAIFISETKTDGEASYSYDIDKVKAYLKTCNDHPENFTLKGTSYESKNLIRRRAWISAVQILINEKNGTDGDKLVVDGKLGTDTKAKVRDFQAKYNNNLPKGAVKITEDGIPGKDTIQVLLDGQLGDTYFDSMKCYIDGEGKLKFDDGSTMKIEHDDHGNYITIDDKKYYEYKKGMNEPGYEYGVFNPDHIGWLYIGGFKNDKREGQGTMTWADDGEKYEGQWKNNNMEGQGTYTWADGRKYEGQWKNNNMEGQGTFTWPNGAKYEGNWENNNRKGEGTMTYKGGSIYKGEWKNDNREGQGTLTWTNGNIYNGGWKNGSMDGQGTFSIHSENDKVYNVEAVNNVLKITGPTGDANIGKYIDWVHGCKIIDNPSSS